MASIYKETTLTASAERAWDAVADFGAINRIVTFIGDVRREGDERFCSVNGMATHEAIVTLDHENRRLVYRLVDSPMALTHHQSSMQVFGDGDGSRLVWITDVSPDEAASALDPMYTAAVASVREALA